MANRSQKRTIEEIGHATYWNMTATKRSDRKKASTSQRLVNGKSSNVRGPMFGPRCIISSRGCCLTMLAWVHAMMYRSSLQHTCHRSY